MHGDQRGNTKTYSMGREGGVLFDIELNLRHYAPFLRENYRFILSIIFRLFATPYSLVEVSIFPMKVGEAFRSFCRCILLPKKLKD